MRFENALVLDITRKRVSSFMYIDEEEEEEEDDDDENDDEDEEDMTVCLVVLVGLVC